MPFKERIPPLVRDFFLWARETASFIPYAIKRPLDTSAFLPTAPFVVRRICQLVGNDTRSILELGPGIGTVTKELLRKPNIEKITAIEINAEMVDFLRKKFPDERLEVIEGSAEHLETMVHESVDLVLFSIPFSLFKPQRAKNILRQIASQLKKGGTLIAFQMRDAAEKSIKGYPEFTNVVTHKVPGSTIKITVAKRV